MIWYIIGHSNNPLTRLTASSFFWLMILAYTCVIFTSAWPSSLDVVYKSAPSVSIIVANVCRARWNRTHKAAVGKQVTIKRNPFEMSGFFIILPNAGNATECGILSHFSYQAVSCQLPKQGQVTHGK